MNSDQAKGGMKDVGGKIQEAAGKATGNYGQQAKGLLKQGEGKVQKAVGDVRDDAKNADKKP